MLKLLFRWLDAHPGSYWLIVLVFSLLWCGWVAYSLWRDQRAAPIRRHGLITALILLAVLLAWRWPPLLNPEEYNPDESQLLAGAITLAHDPVFWRSVDGTTSGPLNFYALFPTHWLGVPQDFFNARLTGLLLIWGSLWFGYRILRSAYGDSLSLLGLLPGLLFYGTTTDPDFVHYSSEHVSVFLIMLSAYLLRQAQLAVSAGQAHPRGSWLAAGLCLGLLPWAKLQSLPVMLVLCVWGTVLALWRPGCPWSVRWRDFAWLTAMAFVPSVLVMAMVFAAGQWLHFYNSYVLNNIIYVGRGFGVVGISRHMWQICSTTYSYQTFLIGPTVTITAASLALLFVRHRPRQLYFLGAVLTVMAICAALAPGQAYPHYLLFIVLPLIWWSTAALGEAAAALKSPRARWVLCGVFLVASATGLVAARVRLPVSPMFGKFAESWRHPYDESAMIIRQFSRRGDTLAVWGWNCQVYVQTGLPQATREAHSTRQLWDSPQIDTYYRPRYMADLIRNQPAFFFEAIGPNAFFFHDRARYSNETYPALRDYVQAHYVMYRDMANGRLYISKDRLAAGENH